MDFIESTHESILSQALAPVAPLKRSWKPARRVEADRTRPADQGC